MGCQEQVTLGNNLTFSICTHDPDTGVLTDTDAPPAYRVYEDETGTAILTGTMTKLDNANTTGFYSELIACTTGNGFEVGKSYNIYITATVDSDQGGISYSFTIQAGNITGTAQSGGASTITLAAGESATNQLHRGNLIRIIGGTGTGQRRIITDYNGSTKGAVIAPNWYANPDNTSIYEIFGSGHADISMLQNTVTGATNISTLAGHTPDNTIADVDDVLNSGTGSGAISWTITIDDGSDGLVDADVWITSDQAGNNLLASGTTNGDGEVTFQLDAGTVYMWAQKEGYNFTNPTTVTVS